MPDQQEPPISDPVQGGLVYLASPYSHHDPTVVESRFEAVMLHHEATVLARTVGVETHQAWGMRCPVCSAALAIPPSEGGQS